MDKDNFTNIPGISSDADKERLSGIIKEALEIRKPDLDKVGSKHSEMESRLSKAYSQVSQKVRDSCSQYINWFEANGSSLNQESLNDPKVVDKLDELENCVSKYDNGISTKLRPFDSKFHAVQEIAGKCNIECIKLSSSSSRSESVDCFSNCFGKLASDSNRLYDDLLDRI